MHGGEDEVRRPRRRFRAWAHPARLVPIPVCLLFLLARQLGAIADEPVWVLVGVLAVVWLASTAAEVTLPHHTTLRIAVEIASITLVIYTIGWGALLAIGFVFNIANHLDDEGSRAGRAGIIFSVLGIAVGECAVMLGIAKSLIPEPQGHGLAVLECVGVCFVIWMLTYAQRQKEVIETDLRRSEERLRALVQHASDIIMVLQADGIVSYTSPALLRLLGYRQLERIGVEILPDDEIERANAFFAALMDQPGAVAWIELPLRHIDGSFHWFEVGVTNRLDDPAVAGLVCNMRDVSERRATQEQLTFQAYHDALTRLPNRWQFLERLEQALFDAATSDRHVAVLFLDVDRFKLVNDTLGHDVGDRLLVTVAERLQACMRPADVVARFGGDEFSLLLRDLRDPDVAIRVAERVIEAMREPVLVGDRELFASVSIGIAISPGGEERASDLLRQSDLAMYVAKDEGRARWELFDPQSAPHMMERLELEGDLWRAIDAGELVVQFQPELELSSGRVVATEALIRWLHPTRGLIPPDRFVPFAEESGLIVAIDRLVLREACGWARRWSKHVREEHPIVVSVNLSPRFMRQDDLVGEIVGAIEATGVDPRCLQIEITERSALTDLEVTSMKLRQIRALGVRVAIDDFGTGYSSLSYLKRLPIDVLKLDKSLLDTIDTVDADVAIVQAAITMGHALGMEITAEGVERVEQADRLIELGCDTAVGWLWSPAVSPERLAEYAVTGFSVRGGDSPRALIAGSGVGGALVPTAAATV
jgi:diguanylate cyclase (GGDEF)-like protein/PAS domain S-box-containing protein